MIGEKCSLISLTYLLLILMAYYGPNAELLGNIKLTLWQFQNPIPDIGAYATNVFVLLAVDWTASIINIVVIRIVCKINVFKILKTLQQNFWPVFAAAEAFLLMEASFLCSTLLSLQYFTKILTLSLILNSKIGFPSTLYWRGL